MSNSTMVCFTVQNVCCRHHTMYICNMPKRSDITFLWTASGTMYIRKINRLSVKNKNKTTVNGGDLVHKSRGRILY